MPVSSLKLLKFINKADGPVLSIASVPYPGFLRRYLWHSTAQLHPKLFSKNAELAVMQYCGGGWSPDKEESQRKAVIEAIERWAFFDYSANSPDEAGINIDASSNGFAAIPAEMGRETAVLNAYCEALERWFLNRIWDEGDITLEKHDLKDKLLEQMLKPLSAQISCFSTSISPERVIDGMPATISFCLCLLKTRFGGAISGAACSCSPDSALERAALEAYLHSVSFERMIKRRLTIFENIIERRLVYFAGLRDGHKIIMERLKIAYKAELQKPPQILLSKALAGPWEPEVFVHRVLLDDSRPILDGGLNRFFI